MNNSSNSKKMHGNNGISLTLIAVCFYMFLVIERPWESIRHFEGLPIERTFAILMILIALISGKFLIQESPTNKWVFGLLLLHFILAPFAFDTGFAIDQGIEYAKIIVLYVLILSVADDKNALKILIWVFVGSTFFYMLHSLWEFNNGRHVYRMGIARMIGVDSFMFDPNSFGATLVLSLPFLYVLYTSCKSLKVKIFFYTYVAIALICIILTGSRSSIVGLFAVLVMWILIQRFPINIIFLVISMLCVLMIWQYVPDDKQDRIRTLWSEKAGPESAHASAEGRMEGFVAGFEMFKRYPFTGVGPGRDNFAIYRSQYLDGRIEQAHNLVGQVLGGMGVGGFFLLLGLIVSILRTNMRVMKAEIGPIGGRSFLYYLCGANIAGLVLLLIFGIAGHNFYRPLWLWIAAWSGSALLISSKNYVTKVV